jgi:hypothetical protein
MPPDGGDAAIPSDAATGDCAALAACCPAVEPARLRTSCETQSESGNQATCEALLDFFCDSAGAPDGAVSSECQALATCCDDLSGRQQAQCNQVVSLNVARACQAALSQLGDAGACN